MEYTDISQSASMDKKFCTLCGAEGHTAPHCPWRQSEEEIVSMVMAEFIGYPEMIRISFEKLIRLVYRAGLKDGNKGGN